MGDSPVICKKCKKLMRDQMVDRTADEYFIAVTEFNKAHVLGHNLIMYDLCETCWGDVKAFIEVQ